MIRPIIPTTIIIPVHTPALKIPLIASQLLSMADINTNKKLIDANFKRFMIVYFEVYDLVSVLILF